MRYVGEHHVFVSEDGGTIIPEEFVLFVIGVIVLIGVIVGIVVWGICRYPCA